MVDKGTCLRFYKRQDIREAMVEHSEDKEIAVRYGDGFGKRPDILMYPQEVLELAKNGATSFHASEERWENPLHISSELKRKEMDELRIGWDLVLDIDCKFVEYSKICADLVIQFLKHNSVKSISCKFSGNKGFHIGVPFEAFPKKVGDKHTKNLFPEAPKRMAFFIKENIKEELGKRIMVLEDNDFSKIVQKTESNKEDIIYYKEDELGTKVPFLNVEPFLEIDTILLSSRHLYRMPYSLHEKSGLVSLPIDPKKVMEFEKPMAHPDKILTPMFKFLDRDIESEDAARLLMNSLDFEVKEESKFVDQDKPAFEEVKIESPIKEDLFPPCMKKVLNEGLNDGRKRAVFILMNFLGKIGWKKKEIEEYINSWNREKNSDSLRENYVQGQLRYFKPGSKLPPNCSNDAYYGDLGICHPDKLCNKIKNPVNYTIVKWKWWLRKKEWEESKDKKKPKKKNE